MHTRGRLLASFVASALAIGALATASSPASADDAVDQLVWLTRHTEERYAEGHLDGLTADGRTVLYGTSIQTYDEATDEWTFESEDLVGDTVTGASTAAPEGAHSMSDDGTIVVSGGYEDPVVVTNVVTGWSRTLEEDVEIWHVEVSGDGSTLLITDDAQCSYVDPSCPDDPFLLAVEPVAGGTRSGIGMSGPWPAQIAEDGESVLYGTSTGIHIWHGATTSTIAQGPDLESPRGSADLTTVAFGRSQDDEYHGYVWDEGSGATISLGSVQSLVVSDDGSAAAWQMPDGIHRLDVASVGGEDLVVPLPTGSRLLALELDADGDEIFYEPAYPNHVDDSYDLWVHHADGSDEKICCDGLDPMRTTDQVLVSDDGRTAVFTVMPQVGEDPECCNREVYAWSADAAPSTGEPTVSIRDTTAFEGSMHGLDIELSHPADHDVTVTFDRVDEPDWFLPDGHLVIPAGEVARTFTFFAWADVEREDEEFVTARIASVDGAEIGDGVANIRIVDDAPAAISIGDVTRPERGADQWWSFPITTDKAVRQAVVEVTTKDGTDPLTGAKAGSDYKTKRFTVTFPFMANATTADIRVLGDAVPEPDEAFTVELASVTGAVVGDGVAVGTIVDDDTPVRLPRLI